MKKEIVMMVGLCCLIMTNTVRAVPDAKHLERDLKAAAIRAHSPSVNTVSLNALELGAVSDTIATHKAIDALSWRAKAVGATGVMGVFVTLAVYVHLY